MKPTTLKTVRDDEPEWTWEIAYLFPQQGAWSQSEYLALDGNHLIEFVNGRLEFPSMPTMSHQKIVLLLSGLLLAFVNGNNLGTVLVAPMKVKVARRKFREPDVLFMHREHADRMGEDYWKGADLVMEVVSADPEDRKRDLVEKRDDYAAAGIHEYWIVDPEKQTITVLRLAGRQYVVHGEFRKGTVATSHLLPGFTVDVSSAMAQSTVTPKKRPRRQS